MFVLYACTYVGIHKYDNVSSLCDVCGVEL